MTKPNNSGNSHIQYDKTSKITVQIIYIVAVVIWIILIYALGTFNYSFSWIHIILFIPLFVFAIGFLQVCKTTKDIEDDMFTADFVSIGLLFITLFIQWTQKIDSNDAKHSLYVTLAAFTLIMLSIIDIWTTKKGFSLVKQLRSIFQTAGIILLIYLLYFHFSRMLLDSSLSEGVQSNIIPIAAYSDVSS